MFGRARLVAFVGSSVCVLASFILGYAGRFLGSLARATPLCRLHLVRAEFFEPSNSARLVESTTSTSSKTDKI